MSDFRFRALISVVFQPLCPACSLFLFRRINDDDDDDNVYEKRTAEHIGDEKFEVVLQFYSFRHCR